jgi:hypothetical protein
MQGKGEALQIKNEMVEKKEGRARTLNQGRAPSGRTNLVSAQFACDLVDVILKVRTRPHKTLGEGIEHAINPGEFQQFRKIDPTNFSHGFLHTTDQFAKVLLTE